MTAPVGYSRSTYFWRNEMMRPLDDSDARSLIGSEMTVTIGESILASGTVTCAQVVDDGDRMKMTVETGGRCCAMCGHVYPVEFAELRLTHLSDLIAQMPEVTFGGERRYDDLPLWAQVCSDWTVCRNRKVMAA